MKDNNKFPLLDIIRDIIAPLDNAVATPTNNAELVLEIQKKIPYPGPDVRDPYPNINDSPNAAAIKYSVFGLAVLSIIGNFIIQFYKQVRKKEAVSPYFFFEKLPGIKEYLKKQMTDSDKCSAEVLLATAYYYNPDLPSFVLFWRRAWAALTRSEHYLKLKRYLHEQLAEGKTKKASLKDIYQQINKNFASYINEHFALYFNEKNAWVAKQHTEKWMIYTEKSLKLFEKQERETKKTKEKNKTIAQRVWNVIEAHLNELAKASYVYWIGVFIFYFFAGIGVIGAVVWPPILIAGVFLLGLWGIKVVKTMQARKKEPPRNEGSTSPDMNVFSLEEVICHIQVEALSQGKTGFAVSRLYQKAKEIIQKRANMILVGAILNGFIGGFFKVSFISWLLFSAIGLIVSISPIGLAIVAASTLFLSAMWGIYSAFQHFKSNEVLLSNRLEQLRNLKNHCNAIPKISLREYDRLFRRGQTNKTVWTMTKQVFKRVWVGFVGVGTGILVLKLGAYGVTNAVLTVLGISLSTAFFPLMGIFLGGGLLYAAWCIYQYHLESQETQLDNVLNSLSHPLFMKDKEGPVTSKNQLCNQITNFCKPSKNKTYRASSTCLYKDAKDAKMSGQSLRRSNSCPADLERWEFKK